MYTRALHNVTGAVTGAQVPMGGRLTSTPAGFASRARKYKPIDLRVQTRYRCKEISALSVNVNLDTRYRGVRLDSLPNFYQK